VQTGQGDCQRIQTKTRTWVGSSSATGRESRARGRRPLPAGGEPPLPCLGRRFRVKRPRAGRGQPAPAALWEGPYAQRWGCPRPDPGPWAGRRRRGGAGGRGPLCPGGGTGSMERSQAGPASGCYVARTREPNKKDEV